MTTPPIVLFVDDDPATVTLCRLQLQPHFRVHTAYTAEEGMELVRQHPYDVICSDYLLPRMTGLQFLEKARAVQPDAARLLLSVDTELVRGDLGIAVLLKPCSAEELVGIVGTLARNRAR